MPQRNYNPPASYFRSDSPPSSWYEPPEDREEFAPDDDYCDEDKMQRELAIRKQIDRIEKPARSEEHTSQ
jgi:hypothetical protein